MSFSGSSYIVVNTSREEGYDIEFRFKTTLGDGLIAIGKGLTFYFLELVNGRLNLHSSLLNKWEGVFIGSELNNSRWQKVVCYAMNHGACLLRIYLIEGIRRYKFIPFGISCERGANHLSNKPK